MARERAIVQPFTADGPILVAILDVLVDLHDMLEERLPVKEPRKPAPASEPAPDARPPGVVPVKEPAPDGPPVEAVPVSEPDPDEPEDEEPDESPDPPPRSGRGSGLAAWQAFADEVHVDYPAEAGRDDIIAACVEAGIVPAE